MSDNEDIRVQVTLKPSHLAILERAIVRSVRSGEFRFNELKIVGEVSGVIGEALNAIASVPDEPTTLLTESAQDELAVNDTVYQG